MIILKEGKKSYGRIFQHILENPTCPFLVHCTAGKDRTGVFGMLLLKLVGVQDDVVAREYGITQFAIKGMQ